MAMEGVKIQLGKGDLARFWEDTWVGISFLSSLFPQLYAVSLDKGKRMANLGFWVNNEWF